MRFMHNVAHFLRTTPPVWHFFTDFYALPHRSAVSLADFEMWQERQIEARLLSLSAPPAHSGVM